MYSWGGPEYLLGILDFAGLGAPGARENLPKGGELRHPHLLAGFPGLPGPPRFKKYRISDLNPAHLLVATPECRRMRGQP